MTRRGGMSHFGLEAGPTKVPRRRRAACRLRGGWRMTRRPLRRIARLRRMIRRRSSSSVLATTRRRAIRRTGECPGQHDGARAKQPPDPARRRFCPRGRRPRGLARRQNRRRAPPLLPHCPPPEIPSRFGSTRARESPAHNIQNNAIDKIGWILSTHRQIFR